MILVAHLSAITLYEKSTRVCGIYRNGLEAILRVSTDRDTVYRTVRNAYRQRYNVEWLSPEDATRLGILTLWAG